MAMQTVYLKEHEWNVHNSFGQLSYMPAAPSWSQLGSQLVYGATCGQLKSSSMKTSIEEEVPRLDKGKPTHFTSFPGDCKSSPDGHKHPGANSLQSTLPENHACFEISFGQPMYHAIIRRRKLRAKAVLDNKRTSKRKQYMHYSRHLHAIRRPRGCGGRFLNKKDIKEENGRTEEKKGVEKQPLLPPISQSFEVLKSESGNLSSSKETHCNTSTLSGSEMTSMYSWGDFIRFPFSHPRPSVPSFSGNMDSGHDIVLPNQWFAAADGWDWGFMHQPASLL
ncbi:nuclear transcription factor Y subunit A-2-like isoform X2 [Mangifera indica]|uniref:nuclear transcription factor Y subunit A-2-like isoform X2 n=1 Tax=Mangifera indica TaxID=29780 RepID=UPI001CFABFA0|nr:nuclear transcription factor Y subunit A-2-like isoform X2 [Mangifera indica]